MKRLIAHGITGALGVYMAWAVGATIRAGTHANPNVAKELAVGAAAIGTLAAIGWAQKELSDDAEA